jgi:predicted Zn-ribbon and HTH transcriptional regulator
VQALGYGKIAGRRDPIIKVGASGKVVPSVIPTWGYRCERCDHEWVPRDKDQEPKVCPKCKSAYWDTPRQKK